jgi:hypothetical protein
MTSIRNLDQITGRAGSTLFSYVYPPASSIADDEDDAAEVGIAQRALMRANTWRHERVATAAYYLAQQRSFKPGNEAGDWSLAESQTDAIDEKKE